MRMHRGRTLALLIAIVALVFAAYASTASNTVPGSKAGIGDGTISGYTVSSIAYELSGSTPSNIDKVTFTLDSAATTVKAKLVAASSTYTDCTVSGGTSVTCDFSPDVTVLSADQLSVIATQ